MGRFDRYERNMEQGGITEQQQEKLLNAKVLVMGVGGLGSGVVMNLAALGVGQIKVVDSEVVEENNFNRQLIHKYKNLSRAKVISAKEWVCEYNPEIKVEIDKIRIDDLNYFSTVDGYDIIVDCFDNFKSNNLFINIIKAAQSVLPPAIPACIGIFLFNVT